MRLLLCFSALFVSIALLTPSFAQDEDDFLDAAETDEDDFAATPPDINDADDGVSVEPKEEKPDLIEPIDFVEPRTDGEVYFSESFQDGSVMGKKWVHSDVSGDEGGKKYGGKWALEEVRNPAMKRDLHLVLKDRAKHSAVAAKLKKPFVFNDKSFVVQYEVRFQEGMECGGAYLKLLADLPENKDLKAMHDKSPYTIMFGPDKCGNEHKLHFIMRHKHPVTGAYEEKHAKRPSNPIESYFKDKMSHLYTLVLAPDNSFEVYVDNALINSGSLLSDLTPPILPEKEIVDPNDKQPAEWDSRAQIPDPDAEKPEDWDEDAPRKIVTKEFFCPMPDGWLEHEEAMISDPDATKPSDWDNEMDGDWEAPLIENPACKDAPGCGPWKQPMIDNPAYKGKWKAPMIDNPGFSGVWAPRKIPNPHYFDDPHPFRMTPISAVALELWSMTDQVSFDNFIITTSLDHARQWSDTSFKIKQRYEVEVARERAKSVVDAVYEMVENRPWLAAIILLVIIVPIILLIVFCCSGSSSADTSSGDVIAQEQPTSTESDGVSSNNVHKKATRRSDLSQPAADMHDQADADVTDDEAVEEDQEEADEDEEADGKPEKDEDPVEEKASLRKRRPRVT